MGHYPLWWNGLDESFLFLWAFDNPLGWNGLFDVLFFGKPLKVKKDPTNPLNHKW